MYLYLRAIPTAGYSGFVMYWNTNPSKQPTSTWMIPGTFFDDWDNQF